MAAPHPLCSIRIASRTWAPAAARSSDFTSQQPGIHLPRTLFQSQPFTAGQERHQTCLHANRRLFFFRFLSPPPRLFFPFPSLHDCQSSERRFAHLFAVQKPPLYFLSLSSMFPALTLSSCCLPSLSQSLEFSFFLHPSLSVSLSSPSFSL